MEYTTVIAGSREEALKVIEEFEINEKCKFIQWKKDKEFGCEGITYML